jgi:hypothetical protein
MTYTSVYNTKAYYPQWGAYEINKIIARDAIKYSSEAELFEIIFEDMKSSYFKTGLNVVYPDKISEKYLKSIFGNYHLKDISSSHFHLIDKDNFLEKVKNYINDHFYSDWNYADSQQEKFLQSALSAIEFATIGAKSFYEFRPSDDLQTLIPITGGPFDHFTAFIALNQIGKETEDGQVRQIATSILLYRD